MTSPNTEQSAVPGRSAPRPAHAVDVLITRLDPQLPLPSYSHAGDAGLDLLARVDIDVAPGERVAVPTGVSIALPEGFAAFVHPRSGLALRQGLTVVNAPGTIDAGYRGEIQVALVNLDHHESVSIHRGDRIAQLVISPVAVAVLHEVSSLPGSQRSAGGFGSTGVSGTVR